MHGCRKDTKEQLLWLRRFETVAELEEALQAFRERYNREWLIERHGWISPSQYRETLGTGVGSEEVAA